MAKRKIATGRKRGHILRMAEDVKTWREVSRALGSIRTEMRIYVGVATAAFVFGAGVLGTGFWKLSDRLDGVSSQISEISRILGRIEGRIEAAEKRGQGTPPARQF